MISEIRTRRRLRQKGGKADRVYDVTRYLGRGGPAVSYMRDGRQVREKYPKNIFLPAISKAGAIVNIPLHTNPMQRSFDDPQALKTKMMREEQGFIWAHECPITARILHPDDERALFGDDVKPCHDHDFEFVPGAAYKPPKLCKHLEKIVEIRAGAHGKQMSKFSAVNPRETAEATLKALQAIAAQGDRDPVRTRKSRGDG